MIGLTFERPLRQVVCLGAHPDDIEIGAYGTIRTLAEQNPDVSFVFVILTATEQRKEEAENSAKELLNDRVRVDVANFNDGFLPYEAPSEAKTFVRSAVGGSHPEVVFTPRLQDAHQDHAFVAHIARQLFRDQLILEYEIVKYDADLGRPQAFVTLSEEMVEHKIDHLRHNFASQQDKPWYEPATFRSLARIRGIECNSPSGYAEAFHATKINLI